MSAPDREDELGAAWMTARPRLVNIAYAILGSRAEAEDVVAETWLRLADADTRAPILDPEAWGTVAVGRAALDAYRSARRRREHYVGPWLPEPVLGSTAPPGAADPADRVTLDETVSFALLVVLETLSPAERTAWVLHDVFGLPYRDIAEAVGRTPAAVRQLATRARSHLRERAPRFPVDRDRHRQTVRRFLTATAGGRLADLVSALDPDVVLTTDGGGMVSAARKPVHGADRVARFLLGILARMGPGDRARPLDVNGVTGLGVYTGDRLTSVMAFTVEDDRVTRIDIVRAPDKLQPGGQRRRRTAPSGGAEQQ